MVSRSDLERIQHCPHCGKWNSLYFRGVVADYSDTSHTREIVMFECRKGCHEVCHMFFSELKERKLVRVVIPQGDENDEN